MNLTQQQKDFILRHEHNDVRELALKLNKENYPKPEVELLLKQISGRQTAKNKLPGWYAHPEIIYPIHLSLEQASSEATAKYKTSLIPDGNNTFVDLTGGMGVDFAFLSQRFAHSVYVEQNRELCEIANHNFQVLGLQHIEIENSTGEMFLKKMPVADVIYLDPSRRDDAGKKVVRIEDCSPNVSEIQDLLLAKAKTVLIKFSPMLDISLAIKNLKNVSEVHVVSVENECKELLFLLSSEKEHTRYVAVNLNKYGNTEKFYFTVEEEQNADVSFTETIGKYLYEPNASILKAGGFKSIAQQFNIQKLHVNSHLYTSDSLISNFPGRVFKVITWFTPNKKNIKSFVSETQKANISVRNFPMSVAEIRQKTGIKEGGEVYLFATTVADGTKVWVVGEKK
ncbi:MAG: class I SAM-dependent methyltransferase [Bacteroidia bacterium]|nr:class I SAM-dependent methyltransferase [Bacteroidia bacterium]